MSNDQRSEAGGSHGPPEDHAHESPPRAGSCLRTLSFGILAFALGFGTCWVLTHQGQPAALPSQDTTTSAPTPTVSTVSPSAAVSASAGTTTSRDSSPAPTPSDGSPAPGASKQNQQPSSSASTIPNMPSSFNDFKNSAPNPNMTIYYKGTVFFRALYLEGDKAFETMTRDLKNPQSIDGWTCGIDEFGGAKSLNCVTTTHGGAVNTSMGADAEVATLVANSKAFVEAWR